MKPITKIEDAYNLPEKSEWDWVSHLQADGSIMYEPVYKDLVAVDKDDRAIIVFRDRDNRLMTINYDSGGAYKSEIYF